MEVNVKLEITAEEFFDAIGEAIVYDIQQATGKHWVVDVAGHWE